MGDVCKIEGDWNGNQEDIQLDFDWVDCIEHPRPTFEHLFVSHGILGHLTHPVVNITRP